MIFLVLGSSIGDAEAVFASAEQFLVDHGVPVIKKSSIYKNPPIGGVAQNEFSNAVWQIEIPDRWWDKYNWILLPKRWKNYKRSLRLLKICKAAEKAAGRNFLQKRWSDRELDLDILMFGDLNINHAPGYIWEKRRITIPHPEIANRDFVINPWKEIAGKDFEVLGLGKLGDLLD